jgi:hypothetical protein
MNGLNFLSIASLNWTKPSGIEKEDYQYNLAEAKH